MADSNLWSSFKKSCQSITPITPHSSDRIIGFIVRNVSRWLKWAENLSIFSAWKFWMGATSSPINTFFFQGFFAYSFCSYSSSFSIFLKVYSCGSWDHMRFDIRGGLIKWYTTTTATKRKGAEVYGNLEEGVSKCWTKTRRRKNGTGDRGQGCTGWISQ